jgi:hypothetical protein
MIWSILKWVLLGLLVVLIMLWLINGGFGRAREAGSHLGGSLNFFSNLLNPLEFFNPTSQLTLPSVSDPTDSTQITTATDSTINTSPREKINQYENQYDSLNSQVNDAKTFGTPSPHRGEIVLAGMAATAQDPNAQYVELSANSNNAGSISLSGWSLQSAVSGVRVYLPQAASPYRMGQINTLKSVALSAGSSAIVVSGNSPVGVSFHENVCSGYLSQLVSFAPEIQSACPLPSEDFPETPGNLRTYGDACYTYVQGLGICQLASTDMPSNLSPACRSYIANRFSYNGCVASHEYQGSFFINSWRLYLSSSAPLWRSGHDIIRLLDSQGRTVDAVTY